MAGWYKVIPGYNSSEVYLGMAMNITNSISTRLKLKIKSYKKVVKSQPSIIRLSTYPGKLGFIFNYTATL